jgi:hypothetical protein
MAKHGRGTRQEEVTSAYFPVHEPFGVGPKVPASNRQIPAGTTETRWSGVLIDLETADYGSE